MVWEEWAGPQEIVDIYWLNRGQITHLASIEGAILFAYITPLEGGHHIGHDVALDEVDYI